jgi:hypothetical protein
MSNISPITVKHHLEAIQAIYSTLEISINKYPDSDKRETLRVSYLEEEFGISKLFHAMNLISFWLQGTDFVAKEFNFFKTKPDARWRSMLDIIHGKISEFTSEVGTTELLLSRDGTLSRSIGGAVFKHEFEGKMQLDFINLLCETNDYIQTKTICAEIGSSNEHALNIMKKTINNVLTAKLQLSPMEHFIDSKRGLGYRINPRYRAIMV